MEQNIYLVLEDGTVFAGKSFGAEGEVTGEVVFTTSMNGFLETLTDPGYYGQIVVQTFPLVGNYGVISADIEGRTPHLSAYIAREWCEEPSNFRCEGTMDEYMKKNGVVGLCGIDTRALTRMIREHGVMNGKIVRSLDKKDAAAEEAKAYRITGAVEAVTNTEKQVFAPENAAHKVVLWNFGDYTAISAELQQRGCEVVLMPAGSSAEEILAEGAEGIVFSNGPADPAANPAVVAEMKKVMAAGLPMFGIGLGHQLAALAAGGKTFKLKYGHRGGNQPVTDRDTERVYITSQNNGYAVDAENLPACAKMRFVNANDGCCEGLEYSCCPLFTLQFVPETVASPQNSGVFYDRFVEKLGK